MHKIIPFISLLVGLNAFGQGDFSSQAPYEKGDVYPNRHYTDCDGNIYSAGDLMAEGKPLIVFSSTVDCGYCFEEAPQQSEKILKYNDKINYIFYLTPHNTYPRCSGQGAGDHDWPDDWRRRYPGYKNIPIISYPAQDFYGQVLCQVTTSYASINPLTGQIMDGACRGDGSAKAHAAALALYDNGTLKRLSSTAVKPNMVISGTGNSRTITLSTSTSGAEIYYTIDGSVPGATKNKYTGPFSVKKNSLVKAIALKKDMNNSSVNIKYVELNNSSLTNIATLGSGFIWNNLGEITSNSNKSPKKEVNDGLLNDFNMNTSDQPKNTYQAAGVVWDNVQHNITSIKWTHPAVSSKRFFSFLFTLQYTLDGITWLDANDWGHFPEYPYIDNQARQNTNPIYFFTEKPLTAKGIRVVGQVTSSHIWNSAKNAGLKELEIFQENSLTTDLSESVMENQISIFPNPGSNFVSIKGIENLKDYTVEVFNIMGVKVLEQKEKGIIDVNTLPLGNYYVIIKNDRFREVKPLVISR